MAPIQSRLGKIRLTVESDAANLKLFFKKNRIRESNKNLVTFGRKAGRHQILRNQFVVVGVQRREVQVNGKWHRDSLCSRQEPFRAGQEFGVCCCSFPTPLWAQLLWNTGHLGEHDSAGCAILKELEAACEDKNWEREPT